MFILADDLTGAAEAGGVALNFGLLAEVQLKQCQPSSADVIVVDTDSRRLGSQAAADFVRASFGRCREMGQRGLFKKIDSVLRGNVISESVALLESSGRKIALVVPANPGLQRTVVGGQYLIDGVPLDATDFANDPEHPAVTPDVGKLLAHRTSEAFAQRYPVHVASPKEELPEEGIVVGEVRSDEDTLAWALRVDENIVPVGSAAFLKSYIYSLGKIKHPQFDPHFDGILNTRKLFVCGSTSAASREFCRTCESLQIPVSRMPTGLFDATDGERDLIDNWVAETVEALRKYDCAVIAVDRPVRHEPDLPQRISEYLSCAVELVLEAEPAEHLLAEGGATAEALMQRLGWERLIMVAELAPGVATTRVVEKKNQLFTMKPGSYQWPAELIKMHQITLESSRS